ncbi:MAG: hypothetical protein QXF12_01000 [Candidatus Aenigmatarchaeota archaeon]
MKIQDLLKYKIALNENKIYDIENYKLSEIIEMLKILAERNKEDDKSITIRLSERGIEYKS